MRQRAGDLLTAVRAARAMILARAVLARGGMPAAVRRYALEPHEAPADAPAGTGSIVPRELRRTVRVARRVLGLPVLRSTCLPTSIALFDVLHREGADPVLVIGVSATDRFSAHAWVELDSWRIDPSELDPGEHQEIGRFTVASRAPAAGR